MGQDAGASIGCTVERKPEDRAMGQARGTQTGSVGAQPHGQSVPGSRALGMGTDASCPDCGHPIAKHEGSPEDEFVASHGGVGYAVCVEVDRSGETADPCGCRTVIGSSRETRELNLPTERRPAER
jgi:hypothetical protein